MGVGIKSSIPLTASDNEKAGVISKYMEYILFTVNIGDQLLRFCQIYVVPLEIIFYSPVPHLATCNKIWAVSSIHLMF